MSYRKEKYNIEDKISAVHVEIAEECSKEYADKIKLHVESISSLEGKFNRNNMWKLKKKILPRTVDKASSKKDKNGNLVTHPIKIKQVYIDYYKDLFKHKDILPNLQKYKLLQDELFELRMKSCKENISAEWNMKQLEKVLKDLKSGKCPDPIGLVNEIFNLKIWEKT